MRTSQYLLATQKETPADAEVISHQLMLRAGMIRKLASGLYTWLPSGLRVLNKVANIVREEMNKAGAIAGMLTGLLSTLLYIFSYKGFLFIPGTELLANTPDNWFLGIAPEAFGALGALLNFIVAFVVSNMTAPVPDDIRQMVEDIRVPKGAGDAQDH